MTGVTEKIPRFVPGTVRNPGSTSSSQRRPAADVIGFPHDAGLNW